MLIERGGPVTANKEAKTMRAFGFTMLRLGLGAGEWASPGMSFSASFIVPSTQLDQAAAA
jgi:hypothetical protein